MIVLLLPVATLGLLLQRPPLGAVRLEPRAAIPRSVPHMIAPAESKATVASDERSKCAFFRVINPSSTSFKAWAADVDAGGARALPPPPREAVEGMLCHVVIGCMLVVHGSARRRH